MADLAVEHVTGAPRDMRYAYLPDGGGVDVACSRCGHRITAKERLLANFAIDQCMAGCRGRYAEVDQ